MENVLQLRQDNACLCFGKKKKTKFSNQLEKKSLWLYSSTENKKFRVEFVWRHLHLFFIVLYDFKAHF